MKKRVGIMHAKTFDVGLMKRREKAPKKFLRVKSNEVYVPADALGKVKGRKGKENENEGEKYHASCFAVSRFVRPTTNHLA